MPIERSKLNRLLAGFVGAPLAVGAFALSAGIASSASAEELEEVVVTGSRAKPRTVGFWSHPTMYLYSILSLCIRLTKVKLRESINKVLKTLVAR